MATATVCRDLDEALEGCALVVGASARLRNLTVPLLDPRQCASQVMEELAANDNHEVAILFGREHSGLTNDELGRCHHLVHIPSDPDYSSLNLAAAVQVVSYELRMACGGQSLVTEQVEAENSPQEHEPLAPAEDMARFYAHLEQTLVEIGFLDPENPRIMMRRLRRLYNRARPTVVEMNILRGILTASQKAKRAVEPK